MAINPGIVGLALLLCVSYLAGAEDVVLNRVRRLINGQVVPNGEAKFMGVLAVQNTQSEAARPFTIICGAVLIDSDRLITTAHCLDEDAPLDLTNVVIVLGLQDNTFGQTDGAQVFALDGEEATAILNPDFECEDVFMNDIAVLKLSQSVECNEYVDFADLAPAGIDEDDLEDCQFFGFGVFTEPAFGELLSEADLSQFLRTAPQELTSFDHCEKAFGNFVKEDDHICALAAQAFPCFGDSGSPLMCTYNGQRVVAGLNSFRINNQCELERAQAYTRVNQFLDFIANPPLPRDFGDSSSDSDSSD